VQLRRTDPLNVMAQMNLGSHPSAHARVAWPSVAGPWPARDAVAPDALDALDRSERVRSYWRQELRLEQVAATRYGHVIESTPQPYAAPLDSDTALQWRVVQGRDREVDELELAELIGDPALKASIEETRRGRRLAWGLGFGGVGAALLGVGIPLLAVDLGPSVSRTDMQTVGLSLLMVGVVSAGLAFLFPTIGDEPVQTPREAQGRIAAYNQRLRRQLDLSGRDVAAAQIL
jgi:hypothetical protein